MPHISQSRHRGRRPAAPATFCTWEGVHPNVLGSLVIRLSRDGYGVLFGTTSDGGRLTLSLYLGEQKWSVYLKQDVTPDEIFRAVAKVMGWSEPSSPAPVRAPVAPQRRKTPVAAIREESAAERADREFEERQDAIQRTVLKWLAGANPE